MRKSVCPASSREFAPHACSSDHRQSRTLEARSDVVCCDFVNLGKQEAWIDDKRRRNAEGVRPESRQSEIHAPPGLCPYPLKRDGSLTVPPIVSTYGEIRKSCRRPVLPPCTRFPPVLVRNLHCS